MPVNHLKFKSLFCPAAAVLAITFCFAACQKSDTQQDPRTETTPNSGSAHASDPAKSEELPGIVVFGNSLTAGFGLPAEQSYPALLQGKLDEKGYRYRVINAGVSGDTSAGGVRRVDWTLQGNIEFLILELGGNDALRGQPVAEMKKNLAEIIKSAQSRGVTVILAGMEAPPNMGEEYTRQFRQAYRDLARQYKVVFIPFVLEGVGGKAEFNQPDGIHPNAEGEKIMTENVWRVLEPLLKKG